MRIILLGYGKLGKAVEEKALERGHVVVARVGRTVDWAELQVLGADVVIENTAPEAAPGHIRKLLAMGLPVVCGTTGWYAQLPDIEREVREAQGTLLTASNFSVGVNIVFAVNALLARLMASQQQYRPDVFECHHIHKKDAPSGTAITLAGGILNQHPAYDTWALATDKAATGALPIFVERSDEVPGTHTVSWQAEEDTISLSHVAHSRSGFALGAVLAAEFVVGRQGIFTMSDVLQLPKL
jgi:4-hydroxy-tetrahydrodipicolinate reductase